MDTQRVEKPDQEPFQESVASKQKQKPVFGSRRTRSRSSRSFHESFDVSSPSP
jgi:hypothetical protein